MAAMFGMIERGQHLRFPPEARQPSRRARRTRAARRGEHLERDVASERRVVGPVDLAHAAAADQADDAKVAGEGVARPPPVGVRARPPSSNG